MAENAIVKILTALLKHQVKKVVGDETLGIIGQEIAALGGDKVDDQIKSWLGDQTNADQLEKAAQSAQTCFREKVADNEIQQWMVSLPLGNLPKVVETLEELPTSPDESKLENALRESIALNWKRLSPEQVDNAVNSFLTCLRSALLPIEKQTLMVIGRSVLRTEDKVNLLIHWFEQYIITGKPAEVKQLNPEPVETWNLKHPYPMPPNFTGRVEERKMLEDWLNKDNENHLFILRALGGFGKSALSWHWLTHDVDSKQWTKVLWWSFYEGDASFERFIEETLKYLKLEVPQGQRPQVDELLKAMQGQKILLIMDGFERALRAYSSMNAAYQGDEEPKLEDNQLDCVNINAEIFLKSVCVLPGIKGKVLMTTRLTPRAVYVGASHDSPLQGCHEEELTAMQKADAVEFFHKQKIKGIRAEIESACAPYGYHPLSLRLLAGRILKDFENPADIVVAQKLKIDGDIIQQKHHVLEVSYNSLPPHEQKLLSTIACFRSPVELKTLESIAENVGAEHAPPLLQDNLRDLIERGLLHFDEKNKKFDLHPIVRRYAYERLTAPDRTAAHTRLRDYFAAVATPAKPQTLDDLAPVIELYHHTIQAGEFDEAYKLYKYRLNTSLYFQFGAYQYIIEVLRALFPNGEERPPRLKDRGDQVWTLNELGANYGVIGQPYRSNSLRQQLISYFEGVLGGQNDFITLLGNLAGQQIVVGALRPADSNLQRALAICKEIESNGANGHHFLGQTLTIRGLWKKAEKELSLAYDLFKEEEHEHAQAAVCIDKAFCYLLMLRKSQNSNKLKIKIIKNLENAVGLLEEWARKAYPVPREFMYADWIRGAVYRLDGQLNFAESRVIKALSSCREISALSDEANILLDLARLRYDQTNYEEAKSLAEEALTITERCGYVLQGADVNLFLAQYALEQEQDKVKAKEYAEEAKKLATCDGPPYYYKVAYEEAERMLEKLK